MSEVSQTSKTEPQSAGREARRYQTAGTKVLRSEHVPLTTVLQCVCTIVFCKVIREKISGAFRQVSGERCARASVREEQFQKKETGLRRLRQTKTEEFTRK